MENLIKGSNRRRLTLALRRAAKINNKNFHILPYKGKWGVITEGSDRFLRVLSTKSSAIHFAESKAKFIVDASVIIHNKDGFISSATSVR